MDLPIGATEEDFNRCKKIVSGLTDKLNTTELALGILQIIYSKGGDYSEKTIQLFAEAYIKNME